jgi:hypothetical protein
VSPYYLASAAIDMSLIYIGRKDYAGAVDVLTRYPNLYNPALTDSYNVAVGYNNRCFAYMQMGELQKAFDDCTASLKYASIPDALSKRQELGARLDAAKQPSGSGRPPDSVR